MSAMARPAKRKILKGPPRQGKAPAPGRRHRPHRPGPRRHRSLRGHEDHRRPAGRPQRPQRERRERGRRRRIQHRPGRGFRPGRRLRRPRTRPGRVRGRFRRRTPGRTGHRLRPVRGAPLLAHRRRASGGPARPRDRALAQGRPDPLDGRRVRLRGPHRLDAVGGPGQRPGQDAGRLRHGLPHRLDLQDDVGDGPAPADGTGQVQARRPGQRLSHRYQDRGRVQALSRDFPQPPHAHLGPAD